MYLLPYILFIFFFGTSLKQMMKLLALLTLSLHFVFILLHLHFCCILVRVLHLNFQLINHSSPKCILLCRPSIEFLQQSNF